MLVEPFPEHELVRQIVFLHKNLQIRLLNCLLLMNTTPLFWTLSFFMMLGSALAQSPCGVNTEDQILWNGRYQQNLRSAKEATGTRSSDLSLPVRFHLASRTNGSGGTPFRRVLNLMCTTQELLDSAGFILSLAENGIQEVRSDDIFLAHHTSPSQQLMRNLKIDSAINVYVVADAGSGSGSTGVVGYYDAQYDWIVLSRSVIAEGEKTLAHEIGHFLSLIHPHFGWDGQAWDPNIHGPKAPEIAPNGQTPTEKADSSNCDTAGDLLCDTPADYNLGLNWTSSCNYSGGARDSDSILLDPDESLLMSYFSDDCRHRFSPSQIAIMQADWNSASRAFLHRDSPPGSGTLMTPPSLISPIGQVGTDDDSISFRWNNAEGASQYVFEVDRSASFDLAPINWITTDTSLTILGSWIYGTNYFWRVYAVNEDDNCLPPTAAGSFQIQKTASIFHWELGEPVIWVDPKGNSLVLSLELNTSKEINLTLFDLHGRQYVMDELFLPAGRQEVRVEIPQLPSGIYLLQINGDLFHNYRILIP